MLAGEDLLKNAKPSKYPLVDKAIPFIFDGASCSNQLFAGLTDSNRKRGPNSSKDKRGDHHIIVDNVYQPSGTTTPHTADDAVGSHSPAMHPLSTPIDTSRNPNSPFFARVQMSKKRTKSQRDENTDVYDNTDDSLTHYDGQNVKRRFLGDGNEEESSTVGDTDAIEDNIDVDRLGNINPDYTLSEETYTQLPLPSPSASPIHSLNEIAVLPPDSLDLQDEGRNGSPVNVLPSYNKLNTGVLEQFLKNPNSNITLINNLSRNLPKNSKNLLLYKLLEHSDRSTLSTLVNHIVKYLQFDLLSNLPVELAMKVLSYLDFRSLINVSKVSKNWAILANKNGDLWKNLLLNDDLITDPECIPHEIESGSQLIEKYHTIDESLYSKNADKFTRLCFQPNLYKLLYTKYYLMNINWTNASYQPHKISLKAHGEHVITCLQFDEDKIVTGADDKIINVFDTNTGKKLKVLEGHEGGVWGLKYIGNTLVSGSTDKTLRVWDLRTGKCTHILRGHNSTVRCLDVIEPVVVGKDDRGEDIVYPKTPILVSGSRDYNLNMWDLSMVKNDQILNAKYGLSYTEDEINDTDELKPKEFNPQSKYFLACLRGHLASVRTISVYGKIIVSGSYDLNVRVWDAETKQCKYVLSNHTSKVYTTAIDHERNRVLSGSLDYTVNIWDLNTGSLLHTLTDHTSLVGLIQLSPKNLVTAAADATVRVWDPETGQLKFELQGHPGAITCFQHNDKRVISGSTTLLMWDINTGKLVRELLDDTTSVWQVKFNDKICVAAVQKNNEAWIEILSFEA